MGTDLGTYHVRVELENGDGWIDKWETGARYSGGMNGYTKLDSIRMNPAWENEQDLLETIKYAFSHGNNSCDCNKRDFLDYANKRRNNKNYKCGDKLKIKKLIVIRPDGKKINLKLDA